MSENNIVALITFFITALVTILYIIAAWKIYTKAGKPGWNCLIPFYNLYILLKIVGRPGWWLILYIIPVINIIVSLVVAIDLAKAFNKSVVFGIILLWFFSFVGYLILGFGNSTYTRGTTPIIPEA